LTTHTEEQNRLRLFENKVLRTTFLPKRDKVTGDWRRLQNEGLNVLYSSRNIIRVIKNEMGGACSRHGGEEGFSGKT
jgi:hypothetical protein